jgi:Heparinase II/III-like protein
MCRKNIDININLLFFSLLQLHLHARNSMLLVDSGRFAYDGTDLSATLHQEYSSFTFAHNTFTIDGCDQLPDPPMAKEPIPDESVIFTPLVDTAFGNMSLYDGLKGSATHTRGLYFQRPNGDTSNDGDYLIAIDIIDSDRARSVSATWHAHPNSSGLTLDPTSGIANVGGVHGATGLPTTAQACVIPATKNNMTSIWEIATVITGQQKDPSKNINWQGWYSQAFEDAWSAPTLVYNTSVNSGRTYFGWLIIPTSIRKPCTSTLNLLSATNTNVLAEVTLDGQAPIQVSIPFAL